MRYLDYVRKTAAIALAVGLALGATSAFARPSDQQIVPTGPQLLVEAETGQVQAERHIVEIGGKVGRVRLQPVTQ